MDISVIIPVYNVRPYLTECLESVYREVRDLDAEVLLIDDDSTDGSSEMAKAFADAHGQFSYHHREHSGVSMARNYGASLAQGDYLRFFDSDDVIPEGSMRTMLLTARNSGADITICETARLEESGKIRSSALHLKALTSAPHNLTNISERPELVYDSVSSDKLIRHEFYEQSHVSYPVGYWFEDYPTMTELYLCARKVALVRSTGYLWRVRGENPSITQLHEVRRNLTDRIAMTQRVFDIVDAYGAPADVRETVQRKLVTMDFNGYIAKLGNMDQAKQEDYVQLMASTIERLVKVKVLFDLPIRGRRQTQLLLDRNVAGLIELDAYLKNDYAKAPVHKAGDRLLVEVPEQIFSGKMQVFTFDAKAAMPLSYIDALLESYGFLAIEGHLYTPRVSIANPEEQLVEAFLVNDLTGTEVQLDCASCPCPRLTEEKGTVVSGDGQTSQTYNYDGTGFKIMIPISQLDEREELVGNNTIVLHYRNWVKEGYRILRGVRKVARKAGKAYSYVGRHKVSVWWDARSTLFLLIENREAEPCDDVMRQGNSIE